MLAGVPETSTTLPRDIAGDAEHPRWREFVARYRPVLEAFMAQRYVALVKAPRRVHGEICGGIPG